jgi:pyruvate kinase
MLDTKGPEIRTGQVSAPLTYEAGEVFKFTVNPDHQNDGKTLFCDYPYLIEGIKVGDVVKVESGLFDVVVESIGTDFVMVKATSSATIKSYRHINLPGIALKLPGVTEQDKEDVLFGIQNNFDIIAMSFVRSAENVEEMREFLKANGGEHMKIISKIENQQGLDNLDEIIVASDGIMVARGDLGIEVPVEKLPMYQEIMIAKCLDYGKPVITATQMIESMMKEPFPTRAEINDIYTAVKQGTDCVMLSGETAIGDYPVEAVTYMAKTVQTAEEVIRQDQGVFEDADRMSVIEGAMQLAETVGARAVVIDGLGDDWDLINELRALKCTVPLLIRVASQQLIAMTNYFGGVYTSLNNVDTNATVANEAKAGHINAEGIVVTLTLTQGIEATITVK